MELKDSDLKNIVVNLLAMGSEREHVEFKVDNTSSETIAQNISAICNSMILKDYPRGFIIWGIDDSTHKVVGTKFKPFLRKVGNEELMLWLRKYIKPNPQIVFHEIDIDDKRVVVLTIQIITASIIKFKGNPFIRIGANTRPLQEYPNTERELWEKIIARDFETGVAASNLSKEKVAELLDFDALYNVRARHATVAKEKIFDEAVRSELVRDNKDSSFEITNLGALLYARNLEDFPHLQDKTVRVIKYSGSSKLSTMQEKRSIGGFVVEFDTLYAGIMEQVTEKEDISEDNGIRRDSYLYPQLTVRELLSNMIMHADYTNNTMHPMVEIFANRIEFTNTGSPIVPVERFVDFPPQTRNQRIARELYRAGISESRGSGWDKVAEETSELGFPAPRPETINGVTRITLTQKRTLADMTTDDRIWSIYIHACWLWTQRIYLTNAHVRQLFGIPDSNMSTASSLISQAVKSGLIKVFDEKSGPRSRKYLPDYVQEID